MIKDIFKKNGKDRKITLHLTDEQYNYILARAEEKHTTPGDYVLGCIAQVGIATLLTELKYLAKNS